MMREASNALVGTHDFRHFTALKRGAGLEDINTTRTIYACEWEVLSSDAAATTLRFTIEGRSFMWKMVRKIVGTLAAVGQGDLPPGYVQRALKDGGASGDVDGRGVDVPGAPAHGLTLAHVDFEAHARETRETSMP